MIKIRMFELGDSVEELTLLIHRAFAHYRDRGANLTAVDQSPEQTVERALAGVCFLAFDGPTLVGTMSLRGPFEKSQCPLLTQPDVCFTSQFAVEPSRQGEGIGEMIGDAVRAVAIADGFTIQACDVHAETPPRQLAWWLNTRGFTVMDRFRWEGKNYDSLLLARRLDGTPLVSTH
jgi:GNAT superfamily N-acetyltransferase